MKLCQCSNGRYNKRSPKRIRNTPQQNLLLPTREIMSKECLSFTLALFKGIVTVLVAFILLTQKSYSKITIHKITIIKY